MALAFHISEQSLDFQKDLENRDDVMAEINAILDSIPVRADIRKCFQLNPKFLK